MATLSSGPLLEIYQSKAHSKIANLATAGLLAWLISVVALHALRADFNPLRDMISDYANGPHGWLLTAAFVALGIGCTALLLGLRQAVERSASLTAGLFCLGLVSAGWFAAALFPTDPAGAPITRTGVIHAFSLMATLIVLLPTLFLLSVAFRKDARWHDYQRKAILLALAYALLFGLMLYSLFSGSPFAGFMNRLAALSMTAWLLSTALRLRHIAKHT